MKGILLMVRQGDILLRKIKKLPKRATRLNTNVLLEGEATGHAHRIENGQIYQGGFDDTLFVEAIEGTSLVHDEHDPIKLEPGFYQFIRQREYDPDNKSFHWVED